MGELVSAEEIALEITRRLPPEVQKALRVALREELSLGAKPESQANETTKADDPFIEIVPPSGQYVYLQCLTVDVGTDGDSVELEVLCTDGIWRRVTRLKCIANTGSTKGFANLKLDKIMWAKTEYDVEAGDGVNSRVRLVSRGTGPWAADIQYFFGA